MENDPEFYKEFTIVIASDLSEKLVFSFINKLFFCL